MAEVRGPFFAPGEPFVTRAYLHKAQDMVAFEAERKVHAFQSLLFRYQSSAPTGFEARHIVNRDMGSQHLIQDTNITYGPWLEGVGSRNSPVTRFKGYSIFRRVARSMQDRAIVIGDRQVHVLCEVLNR